mmetsp:Transcript_16726/g.29857  ORF Transcript_16726/g.29857 Transcript_16726/m.29857 type:complete len:151 (+) Transcript_16726:55-507(+)
MATDSDFLDGKWKPTDTCRWKGWLKNVPCCFCTVPCSNSLDVVDGQLTHKAGTLTTRFMPYHGSMRGNFSGTWKEEGCVICLSRQTAQASATLCQVKYVSSGSTKSDRHHHHQRHLGARADRTKCAIHKVAKDMQQRDADKGILKGGSDT